MLASRKTTSGTYTCNGVAPLGDRIEYVERKDRSLAVLVLGLLALAAVAALVMYVL